MCVARGGGASHMKVTGMLVVSLRGVNFGYLVSLRVFREKWQYFQPKWSHLGCPGKKWEYF